MPGRETAAGFELERRRCLRSVNRERMVAPERAECSVLEDAVKEVFVATNISRGNFIPE
jgi:hypothetical protein